MMPYDAYSIRKFLTWMILDLEISQATIKNDSVKANVKSN